jgi:quinol monooxygenase YgiN
MPVLRQESTSERDEMKYGTIARYRVKPGRSESFVGLMEKMEAAPPAGWLHHSMYRSTTDPNEIWVSVVFESEEAYKRNADSPEMNKEFEAMMASLDGPPEWHDGNVIHEAMRKPA